MQKALKFQQHVAVRGTSSSICLPPVSLIIYGSNNDKRRRGKSLLQSSGGIKIPAARIKMSLMERRERERERKKNPETVNSFLYFLHVSPLPVNLILRQRGSRAGRENSPLLPQLVRRSGTAVINAKSVLIACSLSHKKKNSFSPGSLAFISGRLLIPCRECGALSSNKSFRRSRGEGLGECLSRHVLLILLHTLPTVGDLAEQHDSPLINQTAQAELSLKRLN